MEETLEKLNNTLEKEVYLSEVTIRKTEELINLQKMQLRYNLMQVKPDLLEIAFGDYELDIIFDGRWKDYKSYLDMCKRRDEVKFEA